MVNTNANAPEAEELGGDDFSSFTDRLLLYLTLGAGYAFLGFFGWLLTF